MQVSECSASDQLQENSELGCQSSEDCGVLFISMLLCLTACRPVKGVDHIVEAGRRNSVEKSIKALRFNGWVHIIDFLSEVHVSKDMTMDNVTEHTLGRQRNPSSGL